ncbi:MAG: 4'-phosphopantetheinyl transferase superfamily protein [Nitrospirae bacterium]|nr:MAG: 4'-phosphopantetheinyl transferase superfamily protein [Nitrospirota bacterium]
MESAPHIRLPFQEVHVWAVTSDLAPQQVAELQSVLSGAERQRVHGIKIAPVRTLRLVARAALRLILSRYLGVSADAVAFALEPQGKPYLCGPTADSLITFNIAHSGSLALVAVGRSRRIGVDIELARSRFDHAAMTKRVCSLQERQWIDALPERAQRAAFFTCWTCKEAYGKAIGKGLRFPLSGVSVSCRSSRGSPILTLVDDPAAEAHRWRVHAWSPARNYFAALVGERQDWQVRCFEWNWDTYFSEQSQR